MQVPYTVAYELELNPYYYDDSGDALLRLPRNVVCKSTSAKGKAPSTQGRTVVKEVVRLLRRDLRDTF